MTAAADLPESISLVCLLESALGVEEAFSIARSPRAMRIGLGEADLRADLGVRGEGQLEWCRARVVVAARAAGLEPPAMSVYTSIDDLDGLADSCRQGRDAGMLGRAAIHPRQLDVIRRCFRPDADELAAARATLADMSDAVADGSGVFVDRNGRMIDAAVVRSAQRTVGLVDSPTS
jgi:citrate lyase subunit beta/citryl-CoA lyase